ncbi:MAG: histidine kinase, partial [Nitrospirales bacterium]|nr:histidine kinase [Nitrospirales bacterium]
MEDISHHILDIAENALDAGAGNIEISLSVRRGDDRLVLLISDDGRGMSGDLLCHGKE